MSKIIRSPFYYVRHGQTDWNLENRAMGQTDIPLNNHGINQAKAARNLLLNLGIDTICYSPLLRAKMTAEIFNEALNCKMVPIEELREFNLGSYSGKLINQWFEEWKRGAVLPEGELYQDFLQRAIKGVNKSLNRSGLTLIISHGGVYWSIEHALQVSLNIDLPNCAPAHIRPLESENKSWEIVLVTENRKTRPVNELHQKHKS